MRVMIAALLASVALSAHAETKQEKDQRECRKAPPVMKHPADLEKAKREAFTRCMTARAPAGKAR